jgi:hypothetical protein
VPCLALSLTLELTVTPRPRARVDDRRHTGKDDVRLRVYIRVPLTVRDGAARTGADDV